MTRKVEICNLIIRSVPFEHEGQTHLEYSEHMEYNVPKDASKYYEKYSIVKYKKYRNWYLKEIFKTYELGKILYTSIKQDDKSFKLEAVKIYGHCLPRDFNILKYNLEDYLGINVELEFDSNNPWER